MSPSGYLVNENARSIDDDPPKWVRSGHPDGARRRDAGKHRSVARNRSWHLHIEITPKRPLLMRDWSLKSDFCQNIRELQVQINISGIY